MSETLGRIHNENVAEGNEQNALRCCSPSESEPASSSNLGFRKASTLGFISVSPSATKTYPILPSNFNPDNFAASAAYSMGSSRNTSLQCSVVRLALKVNLSCRLQNPHFASQFVGHFVFLRLKVVTGLEVHPEPFR